MKIGGSWSIQAASDYAFATYVTPAPLNGTDSATADAGVVIRPVDATLRLQGSESGCNPGSSTSTVGSWVQMPKASDCTRAGYTLLGWSTSQNFPVAVAQRQVNLGWGTIDDVFDGVRMIFIPAGGYAAVSGDNNLYPVWSVNS